MEQIDELKEHIKNLEKENGRLLADNCFLRQEIRGLKKKMPSRFNLIKDGDSATIQYYNIVTKEYTDFIYLSHLVGEFNEVADELFDYLMETYRYD